MAQVQVGTSGATGAGSIGAKKGIAVETSSTWGSGWARRPYLFPLADARGIAPSIGTARFRFNYGNIKPEDAFAFAQRNALDLLGHYIRIVQLGASSVPVWHGVLDADSFVPHGGGTSAGVQELTAFEIAHELRRDAILGCKAENSFGSVADIDWVPVANEKYERGVREVGNRSAAKHDEAYYFSGDGSVWTHLDLAEMILRRYTPANGPAFELGGQKDVLASLKTTVRLQGRTPWDVLNELIPRSRGMGFEPVVQGTTVILKVFTVLGTAVKIGEVEVPANANQVNLDLDTSILIDRPVVIRNAAMRFDEIEVRGERAITCFTWGYDDDVAEKDWTGTEETDYKAGSDDPAYGSMTDAEKAEANDDYRKADRFDAVYVKHRIAQGWDGQVGTSGKQKVFPIFQDTGDYTLEGAAYFFPHGKNFESWIPFYERVVNRANPLDKSDLPSGAEPTFRRPFAIAYDPDSGKSFYVEKPLESLDIGGAQFSLYPRGLGVAVEASPRHLYGKGYFEAAPTPEPTNVDPVVTYSRLNFTTALMTDQVVRIVGRRKGVTASSKLRRKVLHVRDAHFWYCVPNTVMDLDGSGGLLTYNGDGIVRDDRARLREVLAFALAWYGEERRAIEVTIRDTIGAVVPLGAYLKTAVSGGQNLIVGTIVSSIEHEYSQGGFTTTVKTAWAETDWEA